MPRSIVLRLTALYSGCVLLILALSILAVTLILSASFDREDSDFLSSRLTVVSAILQQDPVPMPALESEIVLGTAAHRYALNYVRVIDASGQVVSETPGMATLLPSASFPGGLEAVAAVKGPVDGKPYLVEESAPKATRSDWRIQAALDISEEAQLDLRTRGLLLAILIVGTALAVLSGWLVTRRGLAPLIRIAQTAQRITASNLDERLGETSWPTELAVLAGVFDNMLARLDTTFHRLADFSANLAHELRTPINNLMGEAEVALCQDRTPEEYRRILISATEDYGRLARLVDNLLFLARADASLPAAQRQPVDVRATIEQVCHYYASLAEDGDISVTCEGAGAVPADPQLLQRAVGNLVSNALRHTSPGGKLDIRIGQTPAGVEIVVSDSGEGIASEDLPRVFERFYRAGGTRATNPEGTGLGLAIVKSIMDLHGGTAEVESHLERGTSVRLTFPATL